jgi:two-component system sensor histidine kinase HydH
MKHQFNIRLWFAVAGFGIIGVIWATSSWFITDFMTRSLLERESELTQQFFQTIADVQKVASLERGANEPASRALLQFAQYVAQTPGAMRANVYSTNRRIVWSTEYEMVGKTFNDNDDLERALKGERITEINSLDRHKSEHLALGENGLFIQTYLPIRLNDANRSVGGVVEFYKFPGGLNAALAGERRIIWLSGLGAALVLYMTLYWIVQRGAKVIESQQKQLSNMQSAALVGELASAVAHSLRNPMAAIRTSAELWRSELPPERSLVPDGIIQEVDRMNEYVRDLLDYASSDRAKLQPVDPMTVVNLVIKKCEAAMLRNRVTMQMTDKRKNPHNLLADPVLFEHAVTSIVTNAIEAMPEGGALGVLLSNDAQHIVIDFVDSGPGIPPELLSRVSESYFTTKLKGLGLGLALARGAIERWSGSLTIASAKGRGTTVSITLRKA